MILELILALQAQPAARNIPSRTGNGSLIGDLFHLGSQTTSNALDIEYAIPLLKLVLTEAKDVDIWTAVFELVACTGSTAQPTTRPSHPSFTSSLRQTPWTFNTGNFEDISEYRKQVDDLLRKELPSSLSLDVLDLVDAVFGQVPQLGELTMTVFGLCQEEIHHYTMKAVAGPSGLQAPKRDAFSDGFRSSWAVSRCGSRRHSMGATVSRQIHRGPGKYLDGTPIKWKMDVGFTAGNGQSGTDNTSTHENTGTRKRNLSEILVTGELKSNPDQDGQEKAWVDLAPYAREVFRTQDWRFVLGFTLFGSRMRLWHFDRSGSCGSSSFDINQDGPTFIRAMLGCCLMTDEQLGLDPTIQGPEGRRYVEITRDGQVERLIFTAKISKQPAIVS